MCKGMSKFVFLFAQEPRNGRANRTSLCHSIQTNSNGVTNFGGSQELRKGAINSSCPFPHYLYFPPFLVRQTVVGPIKISRFVSAPCDDEKPSIPRFLQTEPILARCQKKKEFESNLDFPIHFIATKKISTNSPLKRERVCDSLSPHGSN